MIITREILLKGINKDCTPCYEQCRLLNILYPAPAKWKEHLIGKEIDDTVVDKYLLLKCKSACNPKLLKHKFTPKDKRKTYNPTAEMKLSENNENVIVTEEWFRTGMISGLTITSEQAKLLGINVKRSGWLKGIIGSEIPKDIAEKYIAMKYKLPETSCSKKQRKSNSAKFINSFLTNEYKGCNKTIEGRVKEMRNLSVTYEKSRIISYIRKMPYKEFLKTSYWKAIADNDFESRIKY